MLRLFIQMNPIMCKKYNHVNGSPISDDTKKRIYTDGQVQFMFGTNADELKEIKINQEFLLDLMSQSQKAVSKTLWEAEKLKKRAIEKEAELQEASRVLSNKNAGILESQRKVEAMFAESAKLKAELTTKEVKISEERAELDYWKQKQIEVSDSTYFTQLSAKENNKNVKILLERFQKEKKELLQQIDEEKGG